MNYAIAVLIACALLWIASASQVAPAKQPLLRPVPVQAGLHVDCGVERDRICRSRARQEKVKENLKKGFRL
jgi:hypothetical protein